LSEHPPILLAATSPAWYEAARERWQDLLIDHANCEKKAASSALSLMFAYPEDFELASRMSRLAREELRHFEQVQQRMQALGVEYRRLSPSRYAEGLRRATRRSEPGRRTDREPVPPPGTATESTPQYPLKYRSCSQGCTWEM
jgi:tRNA-(ms[2]io[6]A)-hydroxylase